MAAPTATGTVTALPRGRAPRFKLDSHEAYPRGLIARTDDITLEEMRARLREV